MRPPRSLTFNPDHRAQPPQNDLVHLPLVSLVVHFVTVSPSNHFSKAPVATATFLTFATLMLKTGD